MSTRSKKPNYEIVDMFQATNTEYRVAVALNGGRWTVLLRNDALQLEHDEEFESEEEARDYFRLVRNPNSLGKF
jgi:hypothetical protein